MSTADQSNAPRALTTLEPVLPDAPAGPAGSVSVTPTASSGPQARLRVQLAAVAAVLFLLMVVAVTFLVARSGRPDPIVASAPAGPAATIVVSLDPGNAPAGSGAPTIVAGDPGTDGTAPAGNDQPATETQPSAGSAGAAAAQTGQPGQANGTPIIITTPAQPQTQPQGQTQTKTPQTTLPSTTTTAVPTSITIPSKKPGAGAKFVAATPMRAAVCHNLLDEDYVPINWWVENASSVTIVTPDGYDHKDLPLRATQTFRVKCDGTPANFRLQIVTAAGLGPFVDFSVPITRVAP